MIFADHLRRLLASGRRGRPLRSSGHPRGALRDGAPSSAVDPLGGNDLSCVVHVPSTFSDGHATVEEMLADARAAGAGALLLTDHDSLEARRQGWKGWHDGVLLLVGHEISPRGGHLLAFGLEREIDHRGRGQRELTRPVAAAGGIGFAAHPFSDGGHMLWPALARRIVRPHDWEALEDPALTGIEPWSFLTDAAEHWSTPRQALPWIRDAESTRGRQAMSQTGTGSLPSAGSPRSAAWTRTMRVSGCADACVHRFLTAACSRS